MLIFRAKLQTKKFYVKSLSEEFWVIKTVILTISFLKSQKIFLFFFKTQCKHFKILLQFSFYVKSIWKISGVENLTFLQFQRFWILFLKNFILSKCKTSSKSKFWASDNVKNGSFCISEFPKIDFTKDLNCRKFFF